eukprot:TRINITY_DN3260_c0_g1_i1.p1 TRINITY_DN3260_c0_g1~~TRINITY_DN3260_c0_g1_i1.p1  ORF type:complete len:841 (-),score=110.37 TRINITY_DN3260_c0_g1_i1:15-2537(-)
MASCCAAPSAPPSAVVLVHGIDPAAVLQATVRDYPKAHPILRLHRSHFGQTPTSPNWFQHAHAMASSGLTVLVDMADPLRSQRGACRPAVGSPVRVVSALLFAPVKEVFRNSRTAPRAALNTMVEFATHFHGIPVARGVKPHTAPVARLTRKELDRHFNSLKSTVDNQELQNSRSFVLSALGFTAPVSEVNIFPRTSFDIVVDASHPRRAASQLIAFIHSKAKGPLGGSLYELAHSTELEDENKGRALTTAQGVAGSAIPTGKPWATVEALRHIFHMLDSTNSGVVAAEDARRALLVLAPPGLSREFDGKLTDPNQLLKFEEFFHFALGEGLPTLPGDLDIGVAGSSSMKKLSPLKQMEEVYKTVLPQSQKTADQAAPPVAPGGVPPMGESPTSSSKPKLAEATKPIAPTASGFNGSGRVACSPEEHMLPLRSSSSGIGITGSGRADTDGPSGGDGTKHGKAAAEPTPHPLPRYVYQVTTKCESAGIAGSSSSDPSWRRFVSEDSVTKPEQNTAPAAPPKEAKEPAPAHSALEQHVQKHGHVHELPKVELPHGHVANIDATVHSSTLTDLVAAAAPPHPHPKVSAAAAATVAAANEAAKKASSGARAVLAHPEVNTASQPQAESAAGLVANGKGVGGSSGAPAPAVDEVWHVEKPADSSLSVPAVKQTLGTAAAHTADKTVDTQKCSCDEEKAPLPGEPTRVPRPVQPLFDGICPTEAEVKKDVPTAPVPAARPPECLPPKPISYELPCNCKMPPPPEKPCSPDSDPFQSDAYLSEESALENHINISSSVPRLSRSYKKFGCDSVNIGDLQNWKWDGPIVVHNGPSDPANTVVSGAAQVA